MHARTHTRTHKRTRIVTYPPKKLRERLCRGAEVEGCRPNIASTSY